MYSKNKKTVWNISFTCFVTGIPSLEEIFFSTKIKSPGKKRIACHFFYQLNFSPHLIVVFLVFFLLCFLCSALRKKKCHSDFPFCWI